MHDWLLNTHAAFDIVLLMWNPNLGIKVETLLAQLSLVLLPFLGWALMFRITIKPARQQPLYGVIENLYILNDVSG